jgi:hypothetical protein
MEFTVETKLGHNNRVKPTEYEIVLVTVDCNLKGGRGRFGFEVVQFAEKLMGIKDEK